MLLSNTQNYMKTWYKVDSTRNALISNFTEMSFSKFVMTIEDSVFNICQKFKLVSFERFEK